MRGPNVSEDFLTLEGKCGSDHFLCIGASHLSVIASLQRERVSLVTVSLVMIFEGRVEEHALLQKLRDFDKSNERNSPGETSSFLTTSDC